MRPNNIFASETSTTEHESSPAMLTQTWQKSGSCPKGTVAIRRVKRKELLNADSLEHFGRDGPRTSFAVNTTNDESNSFGSFPAPEHSVIIRTYIFSGCICEQVFSTLGVTAMW